MEFEINDRLLTRATIAPAGPAEADAGSAGVLGPLSEYIGYAVRRAQIAVFEDLNRTLAVVGLRLGQFSALTLIDANPGILQGRAAEALQIKKPHFASLLGRLEDQALLRRVAHDGRTNKLYLTSKGIRLLTRARVLHDEHHARVIQAVGEENRRSLIASLQRITDALPE